MTALLKVENVHKKYAVGKTVLHILKGVSLDVEDGERVAIVGLSGSGKSTLLHILGGLDNPDEGRVVVKGQDIYKLSESKRTGVRSSTIGFVFQSYHLLPEMDVFENILLPAMARRRTGSSWEDVRSKAMELLKSVGLIDRIDHLPLELSGGEQQRVALARALINDPSLVLADEPTGNLDGATGSQVLDNLFHLTKNRERALVLVTHNDAIAKSCDRVLRLKDGVIVPA
jgi:predicted ABC-type transport system involved in lysophospholipase L1 biosynthesis ATPase subunit